MTRHKWLIGITAVAGFLFVAATPEHPGHLVKPDRIQVGPADNGKFLQALSGKSQWSDGVPVPIFVTNATLKPVAGLPLITRDPITGVLTLPSVPNPPQSLRLYISVRQVWGRDFTVNGTQVTPGPDETIDGVTYSPKRVFLEAVDIVADWQR